MKLLFATHSFYPEATGVSSVVTNIAQELTRRGHEVIVATGDHAATGSVDYCGIKIKRFSCSGNAVNGLRGEVGEYRAYVEATLPHVDAFVVHCAQTWCLDALLALPFATNNPIILVSHGLSAFKDVRYSEYFARLATWLRGKAVVCLSERLEESELCSRYGLARPYVIPNGVSLAEWDEPGIDIRSAWGIGAAPWIITVSNHSPVKNHPAFWTLARDLSSDVSELRATIIGSPYRAEAHGLGRFGIKGGCWYACRCRSLLSRATHLKHHTSRREVTSAMKAADMVVVTSSREAAPIVVLESMAAGTPWISFNVGNVSELAGGVVVRDSKEMRIVARRLLSESAHAVALGLKGRERVRTHHDWRKIVDRHEQLYRSLKPR